MNNFHKDRSGRKDNVQPSAILNDGMKFHHLGIPTKEIKPNEKYIKKLRCYVSGFETSEFGIEWMRFEDDSPVHKIIQNIPHLAFEVENLELAIKDRELIGDISYPSTGIKVAMVLENGAPIEFLEFSKI